MLRKILAFIKRDFTLALSYKFDFLFHTGTTLVSLLTFFFIGKLVGKGAEGILEPYGGDYFSFVIIGIAFSNYLNAAMGSFTGNLRWEQELGTLEVIFLTPTSIFTVLLASALWDFIFTTLMVFVYLILGGFVFGMDLSHANILPAAVILVLTILSFSGLGIISAGLGLILKEGDPLGWFLGGATKLFGGVYFPVAILPLWLKGISYLLPLTYSLNALRKTLLKGAGFCDVSQDVLALFMFVLVLLPLSLSFFSYAIRRLKREGGLIHQ
ncbi:MAG: ABC transporter permease [Candidatus Omnitrophica bacterium]|nr:ABC transporter permease [Candidatus Omnitrophota bacterium]